MTTFQIQRDYLSTSGGFGGVVPPGGHEVEIKL